MRKKDQSLEIIQVGNPVLRKQSRPVSHVHDAKIQKLINDLLAKVIKVNGVGLSAPQVGKPWRIFILASHPNPRYPQAPQMKPTAMINPKILSASGKKVKGWEGCLSVPGIRGLVPRYPQMQAEYINRNGQRVLTEYNDFLARIFQHEYDHLEGILFIDRVKSSQEFISEKEYQNLLKKEINSDKKYKP